MSRIRATRLSQSMASYLDRVGSAFKALREPQNLNTSKVMRDSSRDADGAMQRMSQTLGQAHYVFKRSRYPSPKENVSKQQPGASLLSQPDALAEPPSRSPGCDQYLLQSVRVSARRCVCLRVAAVITTKPARSGGSFLEWIGFKSSAPRASTSAIQP